MRRTFFEIKQNLVLLRLCIKTLSIYTENFTQLTWSAKNRQQASERTSKQEREREHINWSSFLNFYFLV